MGIFDTIKKMFASSPNKDTKKEIVVQKPSTQRESVPTMTSKGYFQPVRRMKYTKLTSIKLKTETLSTWDTFFSMSKNNPQLIGFEKRSRKKFKHLYHDEHVLIAEAANVMEVVTKEEIKQLFFKDTPIEKLSHDVTNHIASLYYKNEELALVNHRDNQAILFEFKWKPFRVSLGEDIWLVGTRETYDGPGELYCFDYDGQLKWAIEFKEKIQSIFGEILFMPYLLGVSTDSTDIFVGSMDRLYRLDTKGNLKARIAISELKESELKAKQEEFQRGLSVKPKTEEEAINMYAEQLAYQFSQGFERVGHTSPFAGFAHDPETDMVFILEEQGRVSAWNQEGEMVWLNTFKNEGRYISWIDNKIVLSFRTGETFWMTREGHVVYGAKLPKQATTIGLIPNQDKYLIVSEDNRIHELHKQTGNVITGSEGHPGMELFTLSGQTIFFDGGLRTQGYFWLAPVGHEWKHYEAKSIANSDSMDVNDLGIATEIAPTKDFSKLWIINSKDGYFGNRLIDFNRKRIYTVEDAEGMPYEKLAKLSEREREKDRNKHYLICMDFDSKVLWKKIVYSSMRSMYLSLDGEHIFTSMPSEAEITYMPGHLLVFTKEGKEVAKIKVPAHGFNLEFVSNREARIWLASESRESSVRGLLQLDSNKKWEFIQIEEDMASEEFGAGLHHFETSNYTLERTDKKKYLLATHGKEKELKLGAAIYEAYEVNNQLLIRTGTRALQFYNENFEKVMEIKGEESISSVVLGTEGFVVVTKKEVKGYDFEGKVLWRYGTIPKSYESKVIWINTLERYIWVLSNSHETIVASISEDGKVFNSQSFDMKLYHRTPIVSVENECFVVQTNGSIEAYSIS